MWSQKRSYCGSKRLSFRVATFSAAAEVLKLTTNSDEFGAEVSFDAGSSRFEPGLTPEREITLSWSSFSQAADESGRSRLYGVRLSQVVTNPTRLQNAA